MVGGGKLEPGFCGLPEGKSTEAKTAVPGFTISSNAKDNVTIWSEPRESDGVDGAGQTCEKYGLEGHGAGGVLLSLTVCVKQARNREKGFPRLRDQTERNT